MKILHVLSGMDPKLGGVCQAVRTISLGLKQLDIENEIACLDNPEDSFIKNDPLTIHALGPAKGPWTYSPKLYPWLIENIQRFDFVIIHGLWQYHGQATRKAIEHVRKHVSAKLFLPKLFVMPHGMLDPYFQRASGRRLKAIRNWVYWKLIEGFNVNVADGLLFTCEEEKKLAREPFAPYHPKAELVVGLGVEEPPVYHPSMPSPFGNDRLRFLLFLSRIHDKKGVDLLIRGYSQTIPASAGSRLVVAGPGLETPYGVEMKSLVDSDATLQGVISFPGMLSGDGKWGAFYNCEAFVLPSHQENFGIAVVEALACGKPVLISDQVNIWREIEAAGAGFVENDTVEGATRLLKRWTSLSEEQKRSMGRNARALYLSNFAIKKAAENLRNAIQHRV